MSAPVTVSIVGYNTRDPLRRCLGALRAAARPDGPALDVVVVDNASADGSAEMVAREFPWVRLIALAENRGFAAGNNAALEDGYGDFVLILNPDVEIAPDTIPRLLAFLERTPGAAAVAPLLVGDDDVPQTHLYRRFPGLAQVALFWTALAPITSRIAPLRRRLFEHDLRGESPVEVEQIPGAAMLIRADALRSVGPLDEGYFMWWEDVDWCWRARRAGHSLHVLPAVRWWHVGGASFAAWDIETRVAQFYRAFYRFMAKHRLHALARRITPLLLADLRLKETVLGLRRGASPERTLAATRLEMRQLLRDVAQRRVPDFDATSVQGASPRDDPGDAGVAPWERATIDGPGGAAIAAVIVNWNGRRFLDRAIDALTRSTVPVRVIVVDNASTDGSAEHVRAAHPRVDLIASASNLGYAGGANLGLQAVRERYAFVMNPDVLVEPDHLERLRDRLESEPRIGAAQGKLFRISPDEFDAGTPPRDVIDSAGHLIRRSRMVVDRGQGEPDGPEYDREAAVFSACGAALFLRTSMLRDLAPDGRFFAEEFFAYKEDIDLCWRARVLGWEVRYVPSAVAHHVRALPLGGSAWRAMSTAARRHSWKNHYLLILRNDTAPDLLRAAPFLAGWAILRLGHALLRDPRVLPAYVQLAREARPALRARRELLARRRVERAELARWIGAAAMPVDDPAESVARDRTAAP